MIEIQIYFVKGDLLLIFHPIFSDSSDSKKNKFIDKEVSFIFHQLDKFNILANLFELFNQENISF